MGKFLRRFLQGGAKPGRQARIGKSKSAIDRLSESAAALNGDE
jgi:hypothetical protein